MAVDTRTAGLLRERVLWQQRQADANGDPTGPWITVWSCRAAVLYLRGGEPVMAERLQGQRPAVLTIRYSDAARAIDNTYRAVDARDETRVWRVISTTPDPRHVWIDILGDQEIGVPNYG